MAISLMTLPPELLDNILSYLSISSLLSFSTTSKRNQLVAHKALHTLKLAVLPREIQCRIAFMTQRSGCLVDADDVPDPSSQYHLSCIAKTTAPSVPKCVKITDPAKARATQITAQNKVAVDILRKPSLRYLRNLVLNLYDITSTDLTEVIATQLPHLRHLELNLSHSYIHDQCLPSNYWREAPVGNPCWNALVGLGSANKTKLRMTNLQSLRIERAGITSAQLRSLITSNPRLQQIWLSNVSGVDLEFVLWLGRYVSERRSRLVEVVLENCSNLVLQRSEDFTWLTDVSTDILQRLSLFKCRNVNQDLLNQLLDDEDLDVLNLDVLILPRGPPHYPGRIVDYAQRDAAHSVCLESGSDTGIIVDKIEVDPAYLGREVVTAA